MKKIAVLFLITLFLATSFGVAAAASARDYISIVDLPRSIPLLRLLPSNSENPLPLKRLKSSPPDRVEA